MVSQRTIAGERTLLTIDAIIDRNANSNGRATVSIRGEPHDIEQVTTEINSLTNDRHGSGGYEAPRQAATPMETAPSDFVCIDWQAAARESVCHYRHYFINRQIYIRTSSPKIG